MNKIILTLAAAFGVALFTLNTASIVLANDSAEQTAEQTQTIKVECTSGAYGQDSNCKAEGSQSQKLRQVISYTKVLGARKVHTPVDTGVDASIMLAVLATGLTGIGAFLGYTRLS